MIKVKCGQTMVNAIHLILSFVYDDNNIANRIVRSLFNYIDITEYYEHDLKYIKLYSPYTRINVNCSYINSFDPLSIYYSIDWETKVYKNYISLGKEKQYIIEFTQKEFDLIMSVSGSIGGVSLHRMVFSYLYNNKELRKHQKYMYSIDGSIHTMTKDYIKKHNIIDYS